MDIYWPDRTWVKTCNILPLGPKNAQQVSVALHSVLCRPLSCSMFLVKCKILQWHLKKNSLTERTIKLHNEILLTHHVRNHWLEKVIFSMIQNKKSLVSFWQQNSGPLIVTLSLHVYTMIFECLFTFELVCLSFLSSFVVAHFQLQFTSLENKIVIPPSLLYSIPIINTVTTG